MRSVNVCVCRESDAVSKCVYAGRVMRSVNVCVCTGRVMRSVNVCRESDV